MSTQGNFILFFSLFNISPKDQKKKKNFIAAWCVILEIHMLLRCFSWLIWWFLSLQVLSNCRSISKFGVPFRSMVATGGFRQKTQLETLEQELDVLVATPGRFLYLLHEGFLQLTNLKWYGLSITSCVSEIFCFLQIVLLSWIRKRNLSHVCFCNISCGSSESFWWLRLFWMFSYCFRGLCHFLWRKDR